MKKVLIKYLEQKGHQVKDFGTLGIDSCDYPKYAKAVAIAVDKKKFDRGILICNSGVGMSMVANKLKAVRAVNCFNDCIAKYSRLHNNSNLLTFGAAFFTQSKIKRMTNIWLKTEFEGGRHQKRIKMFSD